MRHGRQQPRLPRGLLLALPAAPAAAYEDQKDQEGHVQYQPSIEHAALLRVERAAPLFITHVADRPGIIFTSFLLRVAAHRVICILHDLPPSHRVLVRRPEQWALGEGPPVVWFCADQAVALVPRDDDGHALVGVFGDQGCLSCPCYYEQAPHRWLCSSGPTCGARAGGVRVGFLSLSRRRPRRLVGQRCSALGCPKGGHGARPAPFGQSAVQACEQAAMATRGIPGPGLRLSLLEAQSQHKVDPAHARRRRKLHYCCCTALQTEPFDTSCSAVAPERGLITVTASSIAAQ